MKIFMKIVKICPKSPGFTVLSFNGFMKYFQLFPHLTFDPREDMWPVMEAMSQDAIEEMVDNVFKMANISPDQR